jgi:methionyl-tRNA synthetase
LDRDGAFTFAGLVRRYNADLANDLGNLINRTVSMSARYTDGALPPVTDAPEPADAELRATAERAIGTYHAAMNRLHFDEAIAALMEIAHAANGYAESQAPWTLHRNGDTARVGQVLASMAECCRLLGHLVAPFAPSAAGRIGEQLGAPVPYDARGAGGPGLRALLAWGAGQQPWRTGLAEPIFPRAELPDLAGTMDETPQDDPMQEAGAQGVAT